jgi:hypothetical protein
MGREEFVAQIWDEWNHRIPEQQQSVRPHVAEGKDQRNVLKKINHQRGLTWVKWGNQGVAGGDLLSSSPTTLPHFQTRRLFSWFIFSAACEIILAQRGNMSEDRSMMEYNGRTI